MGANAAPKPDLNGCCVLIVEDDYFIASDLRESLEDLGCDVIGPYSCVEEPMAVIEARPLDAAVLDVNLSGNAVYPLAQALVKRKVPFLFVTGYDPKAISPKFDSVPRLVKPLSARQLQSAVTGLIPKASST